MTQCESGVMLTVYVCERWYLLIVRQHQPNAILRFANCIQELKQLAYARN